MYKLVKRNYDQQCDMNVSFVHTRNDLGSNSRYQLKQTLHAKPLLIYPLF